MIAAVKADRNAPSARQRQIWEWMLQYQLDHARPATIGEVMRAFGIRSTNGVLSIFLPLIRKGYVRRLEASGMARRWHNYQAIVPGARESVACVADGSGVRIQVAGVPVYLSVEQALGLMEQIGRAIL